MNRSSSSSARPLPVRQTAVAIVLLSVALLGGCASRLFSTGSPEFACKGLSTEGVTCMSARELYGATEGTSRVLPAAAPAVATATEPSSAVNGRASGESVPTGATARDARPLSAPMIELDRPVPIRSQARVMRIWIAPWEDTVGDLNASGYVYTELEPRRWNVGERMVAKAPLITPLQLSGSSSTPARTNSAASAPTATPNGTSPSTPPTRSLSDLSIGLDTLQPNAAGNAQAQPRR